MSLSLEDLLKAVDTSLEKSAEESDLENLSKEEKGEGKEEDKEEKNESKSEKDEDEECEDGQTKEASAAGAALAREIAERVSALNLGNIGMNKQASAAGKALARALMKTAGAGDMITTDGIAPGATPSKIQVDNAAMEAEGAATVKPMPTGDGVRNYGDVNQIFDAIIQDTLSQGAASEDQVHETGISEHEGEVGDHATPNQVKVAAMNSLMARGIDFDQAVEMVKEAKDHLLKGWLSPAWQENSIAAEHGKEGLKGVGANVGSHIGGWARYTGRAMLEGLGGALAGGALGKGLSKVPVDKLRGLNLAGIGTAVGGLTGRLHGTVASLKNQAAEAHQKYASEVESQEMEDEIEKAAAVAELTANGINFEDAVDMVKQAEAEIADEMEKSAALSELLNEGIDFDQAVNLIKQASAGDMITTDGIAPGATPSKIQVDNAAMEAEGAAAVKPMLTGDGVRNYGDVNQIFDAIVDDALNQGAASVDQVHETGVSEHEGDVEDHATPNQVKVAAMNELLESGIDFDQAAEIVKQASIGGVFRRAVRKTKVGVGRSAQTLGKDVADLKSGNFGGTEVYADGKKLSSRPRAAANIAKNPLVYGTAAATGAAGLGAYGLTSEKKASAMSALMDSGIDFDQAAEIVKKASAAAPLLETNLKGKVFGKAKNFADSVKRGLGTTKGKLIAGGALAGAAGGAYALKREKKAAVDSLVQAGIDFDQAVDLVNEKAAELYGK